MYVVEAIQQLLQDLFHFAQTKFDVHIRQQASQIVFAEIEHQVERRSVAVVFVGLGATDLEQIYNIFMLQQLQNANLT